MAFARAAAGIAMSVALGASIATTMVAPASAAPPVRLELRTAAAGMAVAEPGIRAVTQNFSPVVSDYVWAPGVADLLRKGVSITLRNDGRSVPVVVQVASPQENTGAMQNFSSMLSIGSGLGSLLGMATGAIVGCLVGTIVIPLLGCLPGLVTGGTAGGILGTIAGGSLGVALAACDLVQTVNAADGTTRYYLKQVPVAPAGGK